MDKHDVIGAAQDLIRAGGSFVLATVDPDGVPQVRWMGAALLEEPLTVYMVAGAERGRWDRSRPTRSRS